MDYLGQLQSSECFPLGWKMVAQAVFEAEAAGKHCLGALLQALPLRRQLTWENQKYKARSKVSSHSRGVDAAWIW